MAPSSDRADSPFRARPRVDARRFGSSAFVLSVALHAAAVGGMVWATWFHPRPGDGRAAMAFSIAPAADLDLSHAPAPEPLPPLDWQEPTSAELVELPVEVQVADESRFDPQLREVREPARAIARWMNTPWSAPAGGEQISAPESGGAGELAVAPAPPSEPQPPEPAVTTPPAPAESQLAHAVLVHSPAPQYPRASLRMREEGAALLRIHVSPQGAVLDVEIVRSSGSQRLDRAAAEGVKAWRFEPARRDGEAIATSVLHQVTFTLG